MQGGGSIYATSPSFSSYSSNRFAEIAAKVSEEFFDQREELGLEGDLDVSLKKLVLEDEQIQISSVEKSVLEDEENEKESVVDEDEEEDDEDFEFAVVSRDTNTSPISADEIFSDGQIKPVYPVFNRHLLFTGNEEDFAKFREGSSIRLPLKKLFIEERDPSSSTSSEADDLDALPDGTYCVWTPTKSVPPSPEMRKKSNSTGSSKRWRFRDLLHRSNSDGKDAYVFLTPESRLPKNKEKKKADNNGEKSERRISGDNIKHTTGNVKSKRISGEGTSSAHEAHYVRNRAQKESDRRKSYLPYRQDLVGFFANVNGLNRTLRPF
ncbi:hypothetical protein ACHQM5_007066 [Ranunculus cassubicifolius]